uniref:Uncharacterized protein n=1 Tax=Solanum tuberosum TaxID=4113 RepID=M1D9C0_SOLTU
MSAMRTKLLALGGASPRRGHAPSKHNFKLPWQLAWPSVLPLASSHYGSLGGTVLLRGTNRRLAVCFFPRLLIHFLQGFAYWNEGRFMSFRRLAKLNSTIRRACNFGRSRLPSRSHLAIHLMPINVAKLVLLQGWHTGTLGELKIHSVVCRVVLTITEITFFTSSACLFLFARVLSPEGKDQVSGKREKAEHRREVLQSSTMSPNDPEHDDAEGWCKTTMNYTKGRIDELIGDSD